MRLLGLGVGLSPAVGGLRRGLNLERLPRRTNLISGRRRGFGEVMEVGNGVYEVGVRQG